ncbi:MAG: serine/threonine-protein kinase [Kofleriaceae bacterium]
MGNEDPTVAEPRASARLAVPTVSASAATTVNSPLEALERDEILRTRRFAFVGTFIGIAGGAGATSLPGDPTITRVFLVAVLIALLGLAFLWWRTRDLVEFRRPSTNIAWVLPGACAASAVPFFGAFSPVSVVLVLGLYHVGLGRSFRISMLLYVVCAGVQGVTGALVIAGYRDTGLVHPTGLSTRDQIIVQALVQFIMLATVVIARMSRKATIYALGELEQAVRLAAHREALLLEAREELERALKPGRGRFSEQQLGKYRLGDVLGRGAMGEVYEAQGPDGVVAIKVLAQASLSNPNHVTRFMRELKVAATIVSPHVVKVLEVGDQPVPYLVMEKLDGQALAEILRGKRAMKPDEVLELANQVGIGITAAAKAGVVHRDLKPQNVYRDRGTWKVLDFGVARLVEQSDTLTRGDVVGTPTYMAPEQATGGTVDHLSDLYAMAAILYRAITGQPPYAGGEVAETLYRVVHTRPRRPTEVAKLPKEIDLVLAIGMARERSARFETADELVSALRAAYAGKLPAEVTERGRTLEDHGAWALPMPSPAQAMGMKSRA